MDKKRMLGFSTVFAVVYFFSLNGMGALPNLALNFLLKEKIKLSASCLAYFQAAGMAAWVVKPAWGYISDRFPLWGYRRKSYLIVTSLMAACGWFLLGLVHQYTVVNIFLWLNVCYMAYAFQDVVTDGLMVEAGKPEGMTGQFQSIQWAAVYIAMIITGLVGGYISDLARKDLLPYSRIFIMMAIFPIITAITSKIGVYEDPAAVMKKHPSLRRALSGKKIWLTAFFLFLWNFSPSVGAPFFYYATDQLKFTGTFLGILQVSASVGLLIGSIFYGNYSAKIGIRKILIYFIFLGIFILLSYLIYFIPALIVHPKLLRTFALISNLFIGMTNGIVFLSLLTLSAQTCPEETGATTFALLMSLFNLGLTGSNALGGFLFPRVGFKGLILLSALFSLFVLPLMPYLPINEELTGLESAVKGFQESIFGFWKLLKPR